MRALDLFSGIGGIALAAHWAGIETAANGCKHWETQWCPNRFTRF